MNYVITVYNAFFHKKYSGEFTGENVEEAIEAAKEHYSDELDTDPDSVKIVSVIEGTFQSVEQYRRLKSSTIALLESYIDSMEEDLKSGLVDRTYEKSEENDRLLESFDNERNMIEEYKMLNPFARLTDES